MNVMVAVMVTLLCIWLIYLICRYMVRPLICRYIVTFRSPQPPPVPSHGDELITALHMFIYGVDLDSACCSCVALRGEGGDVRDMFGRVRAWRRSQVFPDLYAHVPQVLYLSMGCVEVAVLSHMQGLGAHYDPPHLL
ncbi:hypothetical protein CJ030_MR0G023370 [Morella rubra]|uniref:Uncharacterized protein n=1 Tax=Morella rubra TaxID=262757 RepID=A0A6A1UI01_9ROSI|nr:hypothetical protein CJ030_MR0G023370 [Morella rubra]